MKWVAWALHRPFSICVLVLALVLAGSYAVTKIAKDIFPALGTPIVYVAQPYTGMDPSQMESFLVYNYEYHFLYINGLDHIESKSILGISLLKLQFHPGTDMAAAMSETVNYINRARAYMPPGTVAPYVLRFDAGSAPVGNLVFSDPTGKHSLKEIQDAAMDRVRPVFAALEGMSAPPPFGGSPRTIVIKVDPDKLRSYHLTPDDVVQALGKGNVISPSGIMRIGRQTATVPINSEVSSLHDLGQIAIRTGASAPVYLEDIGSIEDGSDIQTGYALLNGQRTIYIPVTKHADASTLDVIRRIKEALPKIRDVLPPGINVQYVLDQSIFVTQALMGLAEEGILGGLLTGLMILLFLRDWRSAMLVMIDIPVVMFATLLGLWISGQSLNIMTLGGLALSIGIIVDQSTVVIEHIHRMRKDGYPLKIAVLKGTTHTMQPNAIALISILVVFVSVFFMQGTVRNLFVPLALSVSFALIVSYLLSFTLIPLLLALTHQGRNYPPPVSAWFDHLSRHYRRWLQGLIKQRRLVLILYLTGTASTLGLIWPQLGESLFPSSHSGQVMLRIRAPAGTSLEETEGLTRHVLSIIRHLIGAKNLELSLGYVGTQSTSYPINTIYLWTSGPHEAAIQLKLSPEAAAQTQAIEDQIRLTLSHQFPQVKFSFESSDIVNQVLRLGARAPIEIAIQGPDFNLTRPYATALLAKIAHLPALRDVQIEQELDTPTVHVDVDRQLAGTMGMSLAQISSSLADATGSSRLTLPNFWADPNSGFSYRIQVQMPTDAMISLDELGNLPVGNIDTQTSLALHDVAHITMGHAPGEYDRYNMQRMLTIDANTVDPDLGLEINNVRQVLQNFGAPPRGVSVHIRGLREPMEQMLHGLETGCLVALISIFLLLTAFFQSFRLAFVVIMTLPGVFTGIVMVLALTHTTINIESLMGCIMAIGVATANAIMLINFSDQLRKRGASTKISSLDGAQSRLRPILMTSLAMIAGMLPMAMGLSEAGSQSAPLGKAVIGGLLGSMPTTLLLLPVLFFSMQRGQPRHTLSLLPDPAPSAIEGD